MDMQRIERALTQRVERALEQFKKAVGIGTKTIMMSHGVPGHNLTQVKREVLEDEPQAWPINNELKVVGKRVKRIDAYAKVTGSAKYTADIHLADMLYGKMLWAHHPHARIISIDTSDAERFPGVFAVHIFDKVLGVSESETTQGHYPEIRFAGQPIAGVAVESRQIAEEAVKLINVEFEYLPFVVDLEASLKPNTSAVFKADIPEGNSDVELKRTVNMRAPSYGKPRGGMSRKGFSKQMLSLNRPIKHRCSITPALRLMVWL